MHAPIWCNTAGFRGNPAVQTGSDAAFFANTIVSRAVDAARTGDAAASRVGDGAGKANVGAEQAAVATPGVDGPARAFVAANENGPGCVGSRGRVGLERSRRPGAAGVGGQLWVVVVSPFVRDLAKRLDSSLRRPSRPWLRPDTFSRA